MNMMVVALYKFFTIPKDQLERWQVECMQKARDLELTGTLLLAMEGLNGTLAGSEEKMLEWIDFLKSRIHSHALEWKSSFCERNPFLRLKIKIKHEIVTMGVQGIDVPLQTAEHVDVDTWNNLLNDPECVVIDTRNDYETSIGTFEGAIDPQTTNFRDFPAYVDKHIDTLKTKKVAMFCTGGIRCEKASAYVKQKGVKDVYQLDGGILKYLEQVKPSNSKWQGDCFIFDGRVALSPSLQPTGHKQCYGCRWPLTQEDVSSVHYVAGVSCPKCIHATSEHQKIRFSERQKQMQLSKLRGEAHLGVNPRRMPNVAGDD